jgi:hypothetical protein
MQRPGLHALDRSGAADGQVPIYDQNSDQYVPGTAVRSVVEGANTSVDSTDPQHPVITFTPPPVEILVPLTTEIGGVPEEVWDDDNQLVMTGAI